MAWADMVVPRPMNNNNNSNEHRGSAGGLDVTQLGLSLSSPAAPVGANTMTLDPAVIKLPSMLAPGTGSDPKQMRGAADLKMARESR